MAMEMTPGDEKQERLDFQPRSKRKTRSAFLIPEKWEEKRAEQEAFDDLSIPSPAPDSLAAQCAAAYRAETWQGLPDVTGMAFAAYQSPVLGDFYGPVWVTFPCPDGRAPDYIWMMRTKCPIQVRGMYDEAWEALGGLQIGLRRIADDAQLTEDALLGEPQAGAELARREELAGAQDTPYHMSASELAICQAQTEQPRSETAEIRRATTISRMRMMVADAKAQGRRLSWTLADLEGLPEVRFLPRPGDEHEVGCSQCGNSFLTSKPSGGYSHCGDHTCQECGGHMEGETGTYRCPHGCSYWAED